MTAAAVTEPQRPQPLRPDVFISYSRRDEVFALALVEALEGHGRDVFVDRDDIRKGEEWWQRILAGIDAAKCVVVVVSPDLAASATCAKEIEHAIERNKRLVPLLRRDVPPADLRSEITTRDYVFARAEDDFEAAVGQLLGAIELDVEWLDAHARLTVRAAEWVGAGRDSSLLLRRGDLARAERRLDEQSRHAEPLTPDQVAYIFASRSAERRRRTITLGALTVGLVVAVVLAVLAWRARNEAVRQSALSQSREFATTSADRLDEDPELALLVGLEADASARTPEALAAIRRALAVSYVRRRLRPPGGAVQQVAAVGAHGLLASGTKATTLDGETLPGSAAAVSADGSRVITTTGGAARVFDGEGRPVATLSVPGLTIEAAFPVGRDGWTAAAALTRGFDPRVVVWPPGSTRPAATLHASLLAASPAAAPVIAVEDASGLRLVRLGAGRPRTITKRRHEGSLGATFDPSGHWFATVSTTAILRADVRRGTWRVRPRSDADEIPPGSRIAVALDPTGTWLAIAPRPAFTESGGGPSVIGSSNATVLNAATGSRVAELSGSDSLLDDIAFAPDGQRVVTCSDDGTARVWELDGGSTTAILRGHDGPVTACAFVGPGRVMTGGADGSARVWDVGELRPAWTRTGDSTAVGAGGRVVAVANDDGGTSLVDAVAGTVTKRFTRPRGHIENVLVDDRGTTLAVNRAGNTTIWSADGQRLLAQVGPTVALSHDGVRALIVTEQGVMLVGTRGAAAPAVLKLNDQPVSAVFSADDRWLVTTDGSVSTASGDEPPQVWDARTGALKRTLGSQGLIYAVAFSPDGRRVATGGERGVIELWDLSGGRPMRLPQRGDRVVSLAFDRAGTSLTAAVRGNRAFVWSLDAPGTPLPLTHPQDVLDAEFSPAGALVLTTMDDGTARVWDRTSGRLLLEVPAQGSFAAPARFSAQGRSVLVSRVPDVQIAVQSYPCEVCRSPDALVTLARSRTTRQLTPSERRAYLHEGS